MKKKFVPFLMVSALTFGFISVESTFAADEIPQSELKQHSEEVHNHDKDHRMKLEYLQKRAEELGITTEGKDKKQLLKEIHEKIVIEKAKQLGIKTDGKDVDALAKEVYETLVIKKAKELSINTEGKNIEELSKEVFEASVMKDAKELGIETDGKDLKEIAIAVRDKKVRQTAEKLGMDVTDLSTREIMHEIFENHAEEAKKQKLFPFDGENDFHFGMHKGRFHKDKHHHKE